MGSSVGRASDWKAWCITDIGLIPWCAKGRFSQSQIPTQTLQHLHSPYTQSDASACMCTLKIPKDASHTTDRIHKNTAHTGRNGQHCARHKTIHPRPKTRHQGNTQTTTRPVHVSSTPWNALFPKTAFLWRFHSSNTWVVKRQVQLSLFIAC